MERKEEKEKKRDEARRKEDEGERDMVQEEDDEKEDDKDSGKEGSEGDLFNPGYILPEACPMLCLTLLHAFGASRPWCRGALWPAQQPELQGAPFDITNGFDPDLF